MPLKSKKSPAKKKSVQAKSKKPVLKSVKMKPKEKSIFWQILEERKRQKEHAPPQPFKSDHRGQHPQQQRHEQFAKFAGPRRRAA